MLLWAVLPGWVWQLAHLVSCLTLASFLLPPPSEGGGSHGVPAGKPGSWSLFLALSNGAVRAEHRAPCTARAHEMCSQEPGDSWSLVPPCYLGLGEGGSASPLSPVVRPRPHSGRFGGQGKPKGLECHKMPKLRRGRGRGTGTEPRGQRSV